MRKINDSTPILIFILISIAISVQIGEINKQFFTLDFPVGPNMYKGHLISPLYGFDDPIWGGHVAWKTIYVLINFLCSPPLTQRIILFLVLFISAFSAYCFVPITSKNARLFAGLIYMLNPYTYIRILVGHWPLLFSYAVLPLAVKSLVDLMEDKSIKNVIKLVFSTSLVGFNSHTLFMAFIVFFILFCFKMYIVRDSEIIKNSTISLLLFLIFNLYWLLPVATAKNTIIGNIGSEDLTTFAPRIEDFSSLFTLASMHGFWRPGYIYAKDFIPYWPVLFAFILFLAVHGFLSFYRDNKIGLYVKGFGLIAVIGLIFASGINSPFCEIFRWLFDHTLILKGMRDSHKFVTLLVLAYSYLGALGVADIERGLGDTNRRNKCISAAVLVLAVLTPFIYSFTFFNGFAGQINVGDYPEDWYTVNDYLNRESGDFNVLFFPWHMYMDFKWVPNRDKRISNPAQYFFDKNIITAKNIETGRIYRQINTPDQLYVDFLLKNKNDITNFGEFVSIIGVKYILLTKEVDYKNYFFLFKQKDLELVMETENFYLFENKHYLGKLFSVSGITYINNLGELIEASRVEDITKSLYLVGNGKKEGNGGNKILLEEKVSPVKYRIVTYNPLNYVVFTEEFSPDWELGDKKPMRAYGVVNAYEKTSSNEIIYKRFYKFYLPSYILSLGTFLVCVGYLFYDWRTKKSLSQKVS